MNDLKKSNFARNLTKLREMHGLTMDELSSHINVSKQSISKYEKGLIEPSYHTLVEISRAFNCSMDELTFGNITYVPKNPIELKVLIDRQFNDINQKLDEAKREIFNSIDEYFEYTQDDFKEK